MTPSGWRTVSLGELLQPVQRLEPVVPSKLYDLLGVRWYAEGCHKHSEAPGDVLKTPTLNKVRAGDVTYNKMWTSKNAFAVVPDNLAGCYATSEYPLFENIRGDLLDSQFLNQAFRLGWLAKEAGRLRRGSTSRARLNPSDFLGLSLIIPPVTEQKKIVAVLGSVDDAIQATQAVIDQIRKVKAGLLQQMLTRGVGHLRFKQTEIGEVPEGWSVVQLGQVLRQIEAGWSPSCPDHPPLPGCWGVLKVSAVTRGSFLPSESKALPGDFVPRPAIEVKAGDVIMARANGVADLVGRSVLVREQPRERLMLSDKTLRLVPQPADLDSHFLNLVLASESTRSQIQAMWGGSSGQKNISQSQIRALTIPLPPVLEQAWIAETLDAHVSYEGVLEQELARLTTLKAGLSQTLLSGRVRVEVST